MSFEAALEEGWKDDLCHHYAKGLKAIPTLFRRKVAAFHPEWSEEDLLERIRRDPLLQLALTPEPCMADVYARVQQQYIYEHLGVQIQRLPHEGKNAVYLTTDGNVLIGWRDYCSSRPLDYRLVIPGQPIYYIYVHDARLHGSQLRERDLFKFLSCTEIAQREQGNTHQFVALLEDRQLITHLHEEGYGKGAWVGTTDDWISFTKVCQRSWP